MQVGYQYNQQPISNAPMQAELARRELEMKKKAMQQEQFQKSLETVSAAYKEMKDQEKYKKMTAEMKEQGYQKKVKMGPAGMTEEWELPTTEVDWEQEYFKSGALGQGYVPPGTATPTQTPGPTPPTQPLDLGRRAEFPSLDAGAARDYIKRPALDPRFGTMGKKFAGYDPIATKEYETALSTKGQVTSQELKESEKKQRDLRRVSLKLDQSADILARTYQKTTNLLKNAGIPLEPGRGIGGRLFGAAQGVMSKAGYNEFVKTYKGNLNEAAIALMRMAMPGRSERMVNLYKQTLPDLTGNPYEDISQIAESMTAAYGDSLATLKGSGGKPKYTLSESRELRDAFKTGAYDDMKRIFIKAGVITKEQAATLKATSELGEMQIKSSGKTKSGNTYRIIGE